MDSGKYRIRKRVVPWSAYYFTHDKSYYPVLGQSTPLNANAKLEHLNPRRELNKQEKDLLFIERATNNGKATRQRSVRQETTMFKAGTLPLNIYRESDKVSFSLNTIKQETVTSATTVTTVTPSTSHEAIEDDKVVEEASRAPIDCFL